MIYSLRKCTLDDFDFLYELKKQNFKKMLIIFGDGMIQIKLNV